MKVVVISGHPHLEKSIANATIINELKQLPEVTVRDLGALYPDYRIDVQAEQQALLDADLIVWQFPVYWYGLPSLMKKWQEDVMSHGFAHGSTAKLGEKKLIVSGTTGSPADAYQPGKPQNHTLDELLLPLHQCAALCGLNYLETFHLGGIFYIPGVTTEEQKNGLIAAARKHAALIADRIKSL